MNGKGIRHAGVAMGLSTVLAVSACSGGSGGAPSSSPATTTTPAAPSTSATTHAPTAAEIRAGVTTKVQRIIKAQPDGAVSVAALNTKTGARYVQGAKKGMWTASAYKLFVLSALLIGRSSSFLSSGEVADAQAAIEHSDNAAGYRLFLDAGGNGALESAADKFGMSHTVPGNSDPTFTTTSGADYVKLLEVLTGHGERHPLSSSARHFILDLMGQVEADQRWGVGAAADHGTKFLNKNGWLSIEDGNGPGEEDGGLWAVTSAGVVTIGGQQVLMAVFTRHQRSYDAGVHLVNQLSRIIAPAVSR